MDEQRQLTHEHIALWHEGCALLRGMTEREWRDGRSDRYRRFQEIDKQLTWPLVDVGGGPSLFDDLSGPCHYEPHMGLAIDWPVAVAWQKALIGASGETPRDFGEHPRTRRPSR
jgi:hypothetical protein